MARRAKEGALETRHRILDAAAGMFDRHGMDRTTLAAVADAAQVTRGAVYLHFKDKQALFDAVPVGRIKRLSLFGRFLAVRRHEHCYRSRDCLRHFVRIEIAKDVAHEAVEKLGLVQAFQVKAGGSRIGAF